VRRPALVAWTDAVFRDYPGGLVTRKSVGFLVRNKGGQVRLAQTADRHGIEQVLTIPSVNVLSIKYLDER